MTGFPSSFTSGNVSIILLEKIFYAAAENPFIIIFPFSSVPLCACYNGSTPFDVLLFLFWRRVIKRDIQGSRKMETECHVKKLPLNIYSGVVKRLFYQRRTVLSSNDQLLMGNKIFVKTCQFQTIAYLERQAGKNTTLE